MQGISWVDSLFLSEELDIDPEICERVRRKRDKLLLEEIRMRDLQVVLPLHFQVEEPTFQIDRYHLPFKQ